MRSYKIWNKKDSINGCEANDVIKSLNIKNDDEIFLVIDKYGNITNIETASIIKSNFKMDISLTLEEVAEQYIFYLDSLDIEQQQKLIDEQQSEKRLIDRIDNLEKTIVNLESLITKLLNK